mmetsp:Transcript_20067/g.33130  ORF Transcript_20067/g.33130 Transcript_20067/m.33130 type:complete len:83 (-) Transcript_20067:136-384(-)
MSLFRGDKAAAVRAQANAKVPRVKNFSGVYSKQMMSARSLRRWATTFLKTFALTTADRVSTTAIINNEECPNHKAAADGFVG